MAADPGVAKPTPGAEEFRAFGAGNFTILSPVFRILYSMFYFLCSIF
jgi:hypothetical protein